MFIFTRNLNSSLKHLTILFVKYKIKKSAFSVIFLLGVLSGVSLVHADLDKKFRKEFPKIVENLCQSLMDYELTDQVLVPDKEQSWYWIGKSLEFHDRVNCFLNRSVSKMVEHYKAEEAELHPDGYGKELVNLKTVKPDEKSCHEMFLQAGQDQKKFHTECPDGYDLPFSSCRVTETLLNEWCGYNLFLLGKQQDDKSFLDNIWYKNGSKDHEKLKSSPNKKSLKEWNATYAALEAIFNPPVTDKKNAQTQMTAQAKTLYQMEMDRTEKSILAIVEWYRRFEMNYRVHVWMEAELKKIQDIQILMQTLRGSYATYPVKFINASSPY
jgi:hypothetical protein